MLVLLAGANPANCCCLCCCCCHCCCAASALHIHRHILCIYIYIYTYRKYDSSSKQQQYQTLSPRGNATEPSGERTRPAGPRSASGSRISPRASGSRTGPRAPRLRPYGAIKGIGSVHKREKVFQRCPQQHSLIAVAASRGAVRATGLQRCPQRKPLSAFSTARERKHMDPSKRKHMVPKLPAATVFWRRPQLQAFSAARSESLSALSARHGNESTWIRPKGNTWCQSCPQRQSFGAVLSYRPLALPAAKASQRFQHGTGTKAHGSVQKETQCTRANRH
jgi:hypothetical protein